VVTIELTVDIARPPEEVFAVLTDVERVPDWQDSALDSHCDGPLRQGAQITERRRIMGRDFETVLEVTEHEPPRRLTLRTLDGPVPFVVEHELSENGDGTSVHVKAEGKPAGKLRFAAPMVKRQAEQELRGDFERLKDLLEAGGYPSSSAPVD
jgi:uncharacterized protein YndB with AHSA1/START domain